MWIYVFVGDVFSIGVEVSAIRSPAGTAESNEKRPCKPQTTHGRKPLERSSPTSLVGKAKAQRCRVASRTESESVMFIVVGSRSDPSAIACEQRRPDVIVLFGCWTGRAHVHTADVAPGRSPRALCDVTDDCACDCGARVGADRSRRLTVYRITLAVSLLLQLNCAPVRAGSCPLLAHTLAQAGRRGASGPVAWMQSSNEHNECLITAIM